MNSWEMKSSWILKKCSEVLHGTGTWHLKIWWTQEDVKIIWCLNCIQTGSSFNDFFKSSLGRLYISSIFSSGHFFSNDHVNSEVNGPQSARSFNWNWSVRKKFSGSKYTVGHELLHQTLSFSISEKDRILSVFYLF